MIENAHSSYTISDIDRYLNGSMTAKEMHEMERAALQDPFLADAIEGYRDANKQQSETHLNEIKAAISGRQSTTIIPFVKKKNYGWQIAASIIIVISAGILLFNRQVNNETTAPLADNTIKKEERKDSFATENLKPAAPLSQNSAAIPAQSNEVFYSKKSKTANKATTTKIKEEPAPAVTALPSQLKDETATLASPSLASPGLVDNKTITTQRQQSLPAMADTLNKNSLAETVVTGFATRKAKSVSANSWTTDKGKPFLLSDVEVITIGKKTKQATDTSVVKPEGGWQSFHDYLFSKMNKNDTARFANAMRFSDNLELEFSFNETGFPYNIKVLHVKDSTVANEVISAIETGPKWISSDKKEKRLNIKY